LAARYDAWAFNYITNTFKKRQAQIMQHLKHSFHLSAVALFVLVCTLGLLGCQQSASNNPANPTAVVAASPSPSTPVITGGTVPAITPAASPVSVSAPASAPAPVVANPTKVTDLTQGKDFEVAMLDTSKVKLSKLVGRRKVLVINFWATWCGPCRREIPELVALQKNYQGNKDVEIIGLTIEDPAQFSDMVKAFSKQFEINYKIGFSPMPMFMAFNGTDPRGPIPQTFIIGKDGQLLQHIKGMRPAFKDYIQQTVDLALKS
jgi:thiol-disulfide isomerase/thioredoxin